MFQLDLKSRKSIYEQIVDGCKELIISGVMKKDEKLPSVRELSKSLSVNPNTIQKAYRELEYQGYVYSVTGLGTFVAEREHAAVDEAAVTEILQRIKKDVRELLFLGLDKDEIKKRVTKLLEERSV